VELAPGTILLGKYRIDALIGSGGMGNVVRASHLYLHQSFAIKILLPQMAESDSTKQRFLREAQATVKLKGEHCARVMDVGVTPEGAPFMVMEFLEGNDLNQILRHYGPQQPAIVVDLILQACEGIAEAHALGIVHRDIKPSNFFITRRPDGSMLLKILDFGISKAPVLNAELTATQTVIGTPSYMAPEQMKSGRAADPRSDIWSIGIVAYQLLTGRTPFMGESYAELVLKVGLEPPAPILMPLPDGLGDVVLRCLQKDPAARYQDVGELARMLAPYASDPISGMQSAGRTMRILQQHGAPGGLQSSLLGGMPPPPISPVQLTPRSWPPSQNTSVSRGVGQVTFRTRGSRGLLIAGVASLCILAGVGGYAISQATKSTSGRSGPHVDAPPMRSEPPPPPPTTPAAPTPAASTPPATTATPAKTPAPVAKPAAADAPASPPAATEAKPPATAPVTEPDAAAPRATESTPSAKSSAEPRPEPKPAEPKPAKPRPKPKKSDGLFDTRH
jgi:eukaryotic-like serine/threonine-protein kinase